MKDVEFTYSDLCFKANVRKNNYVEVIDFPHEVEYENVQNKVQLTDAGLEIFLIKSIPRTWDELQYSGLKGPLLTARRQDSLNRLYEREAERYK